MDRKILYLKLYDELLGARLIEENNFTDDNGAKEEYLKIIETVFKDYYILDQLHELK